MREINKIFLFILFIWSKKKSLLYIYLNSQYWRNYISKTGKYTLILILSRILKRCLLWLKLSLTRLTDLKNHINIREMAQANCSAYAEVLVVHVRLLFRNLTLSFYFDVMNSWSIRKQALKVQCVLRKINNSTLSYFKDKMKIGNCQCTLSLLAMGNPKTY